jgi:hypothetical protein
MAVAYRVRQGVLGAAALILVAGAGQARVEVDFAKPDVSYSATRILEAEQGSFRQQFHYVKDKTRSEMEASGQTIVTITRDDLGVVWMIMGPSMYMETSMADVESYGQSTEGSPDAMEVVEYTEVGPETIDGYDTTKYRVRAEDADGDEILGHFWVTEERIPVRMEMDFTLESEPEQQRVVVRLEDLVVGPQDDSLFEVPPDAQKLEMGGIPGFDTGSFQEQLKQSAGDSVKQGATEAVEQTTRDRVKEGVTKGLKKLFGG